jgi:hypothetical protein
VGEVALRFLQAGLENSAAKGTAVQATRILAARISGTSFTQERTWVDEDRGSFALNYRFTQGAKDYSFTLDADASYEQLAWLFQTAVKGSVSPTGGAVTFTPSTTGVTGDDLQSATIDFGDDSQAYQMKYCEANSFSLGFDTIGVGGTFPLKFSGNYRTKSLGSNSQPSNASLTYPTLTTIEATSGTFYLGTTATAFASLPAVSGSLRSFSLNYDNKLAPKIFVGDGKEYSALGRGKRVVTFEGTFEGNSTGVSRFVDWDLATPRRMRLKFVDGGKSFTIDGQVVFTSFDPVGAVETNTVYAMAGEFQYDSTLTAEVVFAFVNGETSYT